MKFGVILPNFGKLMSSEILLKAAEMSEELDYDSVWSTDHVLVPKKYVEPYGRLVDCLATLAFIASSTKNIKLGTSCVVLPLRNPVIVAKQTAALDFLTNGRLIVGIGTGWMQDEFNFLGRSFEKRRALTDEGIKILRTLWRKEKLSSFKGESLSFENAVFEPKPIQKNGPQIWIGGNSTDAIKRAAKLGDGWHPFGQTPEQIKKKTQILTREAKNRKITVSCRTQIIVGRDALLTSPSDLLVYECDGYTIEKNKPDVVIFPTSTEQVVQIVKACNEYGVPFLPRGAGTSLAGGCLPVGGGVMIALTRMKRILEVSTRDRYAVVEAGVVNLWLTNHLKPQGFHYAPDPSSQGACTIGGNVATNSGGPHTLKYGVTVNHILGLEFVLPDGRVVQTGGPTEDNPGYDLTGVIVGSEGTFGIATQAWVRITRNPWARANRRAAASA